jgi:integral membrane protein
VDEAREADVNGLRRLRLVGILEGISFLLLLFVAMPLKYRFGMPIAVRIAGSVHGGLFLFFVFTLSKVADEREWPRKRTVWAFIAALLPFGPFVLEGSLRKEIDSGAAGGPGS